MGDPLSCARRSVATRVRARRCFVRGAESAATGVRACCCPLPCDAPNAIDDFGRAFCFALLFSPLLCSLCSSSLLSSLPSPTLPVPFPYTQQKPTPKRNKRRQDCNHREREAGLVRVGRCKGRGHRRGVGKRDGEPRDRVERRRVRRRRDRRRRVRGRGTGECAERREKRVGVRTTSKSAGSALAGADFGI